MSDLSTLDVTQPDNTDLASAGAQEIRTTRDSIVTSFGIEHYLTGEHKFLSGNTAARPAAGKAGRIYINTETDTLQRDTGSAWVELHTEIPVGKSTPAFIQTADESTVVIPVTETIIAEEQLTFVRSGAVHEVEFMVGGFISITAPTGNGLNTLMLRVRKDGTAAVVDGAVVRTSTFQSQSDNTIKIPWNAGLMYADTFSAGVHRYKLTAQTAISLFTNVYSRTHVYGKLIEHA